MRRRRTTKTETLRPTIRHRDDDPDTGHARLNLRRRTTTTPPNRRRFVRRRQSQTLSRQSADRAVRGPTKDSLDDGLRHLVTTEALRRQGSPKAGSEDVARARTNRRSTAGARKHRADCHQPSTSGSKNCDWRQLEQVSDWHELAVGRSPSWRLRRRDRKLLRPTDIGRQNLMSVLQHRIHQNYCHSGN